VTARPYKEAFSHEKAVDIIRSGSGTHFDPVIVDVFLEISGTLNNIAIEEDAEP
jgi:putative two-component system response regulator